jgi:hypothetical protein
MLKWWWLFIAPMALNGLVAFRMAGYGRRPGDPHFFHADSSTWDALIARARETPGGRRLLPWIRVTLILTLVCWIVGTVLVLSGR